MKHMFNDVALREKLAANKLQFSSANSMNIGRLVPQIVYYVYAYAQLVKSGEIVTGEKSTSQYQLETSVISGCLYAKQIGLPVGKLICASNDNNVLTDFFKTRVWPIRNEFKVTTSPSMDILSLLSNLERLIFHLLGNNAVKTTELMNALNTQGQYELTDFDAEILELFAAEYATEEETAAEIKRVYQTDAYIEDPIRRLGSSAVYRKYQAATGDTTTQ